MTDRRPVIADVAREAGVSVPTVSRVLTGSTPVSEPTRRRVLDAIETLQFLPNQSARALVRGTRSIVGVVAGNTTRYGYATTIGGIEEAARRADLGVSITVVDSDDPESVSASVSLMLRQSIFGAIVLEFDRQGTLALEALPSSVPVVAVSTTLEGRAVRRVLFDDRHGGRVATEYLLRLGHATVHHVASSSGRALTGRERGWRDALEAAGLPVPPTFAAADWTPDAGYAAGRELVRDRSVTAVLCANDEIAFGVMRAASDAGVRVPEDLMVVGFDDHPLSEFWSPSLTTMAQDFAELGSEAVRSLLGDDPVVRGPRKGKLELLIRDSTARRS